MTIRVLFLCAAALLGLSTAAMADTSRETFAPSEWRCTKTMSKARAAHFRAAGRCVQDCVDKNGAQASSCYFGYSSDLCTIRAQARGERRVLGSCAAEGCPECFSADCPATARWDLGHLASARGYIAWRTQCIAADGSAEGRRCHARLERRIDRYYSAIEECSRECFARVGNRRANAAGCELSGIGTRGSDAGFERCIDKARNRFLRGCRACGDAADCVSPGAAQGSCNQLITEIEQRTTDFYGNLPLCLDETRCGDGAITGSESCDSGNGCSFREVCTNTCQCEAVPVVCGDGWVEGDEICDGFNDYACEYGTEACGPDCTCIDRPQNCGDGYVSGDEVCEDSWDCNRETEICASDCSACLPRPEVCGDGWIAGAEECEVTGRDEGGCPLTDYCTTECRCARRPDACEIPSDLPAGGGTLDIEVPPVGIHGTGCTGRSDDGEAVVRWTAEETAEYFIHTCRAASDGSQPSSVSVSVRDGDCRIEASEVTCNTGGCPWPARGSQIALDAEAGQTYFILVNSVWPQTESTKVRLEVSRTAYGSAAQAFLADIGSLLD